MPGMERISSTRTVDVEAGVLTLGDDGGKTSRRGVTSEAALVRARVGSAVPSNGEIDGPSLSLAAIGWSMGLIEASTALARIDRGDGSPVRANVKAIANTVENPSMYLAVSVESQWP